MFLEGGFLFVGGMLDVFWTVQREPGWEREMENCASVGVHKQLNVVFKGNSLWKEAQNIFMVFVWKETFEWFDMYGGTESKL